MRRTTWNIFFRRKMTNHGQSAFDFHNRFISCCTGSNPLIRLWACQGPQGYCKIRTDINLDINTLQHLKEGKNKLNTWLLSKWATHWWDRVTPPSIVALWAGGCCPGSPPGDLWTDQTRPPASKLYENIKIYQLYQNISGPFQYQITLIWLASLVSIPDICHERYEYVRVNFFWPV